MDLIKPIVGQWYRGASDELFEVVAIDVEDQSIEVQYFDGSITEMDFDAWREELLDGAIELADAPEDWSGSVDVVSEDLDRSPEDHVTKDWHGQRAAGE